MRICVKGENRASGELAVTLYIGVHHNCSPLASPPAAKSTGDLDVDRETLLTLYDTMGGPYWQHNDGWATNDDDMDTWSFVSVEGEFVVSVLLALNNLTGETLGPRRGGTFFFLDLPLGGSR